MHTEEIRLIEELAYNAWPASIVQIVDGWRVRFHHVVLPIPLPNWQRYAS